MLQEYWSRLKVMLGTLSITLIDHTYLWPKQL